MEIVKLIAAVLYVFFIMLLTFTPRMVTFNDQPVIMWKRFVLAVLIWPVLGLLFSFIGLIGQVLLSPFDYIFM